MSNTKNLHEESAVVDNNILVDLYELGRLDILFNTFHIVSIPKKIYYDELPENIQDEISNFKYELSIIDSEEGYEIYHSLSVDRKYRNLSIHDKIAIAIAKQSMFFCNSNDALVKKACQSYHVNHLGILGLLEKSYNNGIITFDVLTFLAYELASNRTSCYIKSSIVKSFIERINSHINK